MKSLFLVAGALVLSPASQSYAQDGGQPDNPECLGRRCGAPTTEGGGCGCGCGCSVWVRYTDDGVTLSTTDDTDGDGIADAFDNCPFVPNRDQRDRDGDGIGDACDNCVNVANRDQHDINANGIGDACDPDMDGDGIPNPLDNCPRIPNADQAWNGVCRNPDGSPKGDRCCDDIDGDGIANGRDNCPKHYNPDQSIRPEWAGDCSHDQDHDGVDDAADNCPIVYNPDQKDTDGNGIGDACDHDIDGDGVLNENDNCPLVANPDQRDTDNAGVGDVCNPNPGCYHPVRGEPDCLHPNSPFKISAGGHVELTKPGKVRLGLLANRTGAAMTVSYRLVASPAGSRATIDNALANISHSTRYVYTMPTDAAPTLHADKEGIYKVEATARLAFSDRAWPEIRESTDTLTVNVGGGRHAAGGCVAFPVGAVPVAAIGVSLLAFIRRRRR